MSYSSDRFEHRSMKKIGPDRDRWAEAEQEHEQRREQGTATHARYPHKQPDRKPRKR